MSDLWTEIEGRMALLDRALKEYARRGENAAAAEQAYRTALATEELRLKADGMAATLIRDVARGSKDVARLAFDRDCKQALYEAAGEAINIYKIELRILENQYAREWSMTGRE